MSKTLTDAFHILGSVMQYRGCVEADGGFQYTHYTSVYDREERKYYYKTYEDFALREQKIKLTGTEMEFHSLLKNGCHFI